MLYISNHFGIRSAGNLISSSNLLQSIAERLKNYGARKVEVFGSYATGRITPQSDVDLIVEFSPRKSLLELIKIEQDLSTEFGVKIDLLTPRSISPYILREIEAEKMVLVDEK